MCTVLASVTMLVMNLMHVFAVHMLISFNVYEFITSIFLLMTAWGNHGYYGLMIVTKYCSNKQVVHPAPGNFSGTLVNGILHHCSLPTVSLSNIEVLPEEDASDDEFSDFATAPSYTEQNSSAMSEISVRPGIVHRLDKGTSGLLVVAKVMTIKSS